MSKLKLFILLESISSPIILVYLFAFPPERLDILGILYILSVSAWVTIAVFILLFIKHIRG